MQIDSDVLAQAIRIALNGEDATAPITWRQILDVLDSITRREAVRETIYPPEHEAEECRYTGNPQEKETYTIEEWIQREKITCTEFGECLQLRDVYDLLHKQEMMLESKSPPKEQR